MKHNRKTEPPLPIISYAKDRTAIDFELDAMSVETFARRNGIGRVKAYDEIKCGRLKTMKVGRRTLITQEAAAEWRQNCQQEG